MKKPATFFMVVITLFVLYAGCYDMHASQRPMTKPASTSVKRLWNCAENPKKYNCAPFEMGASKRFMAQHDAQSIHDKLMKKGIRVTKQQVKAVKNVEKGFQNVVTKPHPQVKPHVRPRFPKKN